MSIWNTLLNLVGTLARNKSVQRAARDIIRGGVDSLGNPSRTDASRAHNGGHTPHGSSGHETATPAASRLPDRGNTPPLTLTYSPSSNGAPDPGEIVWAFVHFEEDPTQGKDRPVLVIAEETPGEIIALMLTSRDRGIGDHTDAHGNRWIDVGTGSWDAKRRPSEVRVDRLLRLRADSVRREGGKLDRETFNKVAKATREAHNW